MRMKKRLVVLFLFCVSWLLQAADSPKYEIRAVWLTTVYGLDWPRFAANSEHSRKAQQEAVSDMLDRLQDANFNTVFFQVRLRGDVAYRSAIEPMSYVFSGKEGVSPGYDPLAYVIKECHQRGMECHAWFVTFPLGTDEFVRKLGKKSVVKRHPELCKKHKGEWYLDPGIPGTTDYILSLVREIVSNYDIDGIHANCEKAVMKMIQTDNLLSTTKIFTYNFATDTDFYANVENKNLANFNDDFMVSARKFIKGDEDMLNTISYKIKANPPAVAVVNYVANHNTFTLYDAVSYDKKYNQANGENNRDGAVYNYSWNCGAEGDTRKRKINELRKHQIKNALSLVLLSQGVPMIYAGDEMCNSQKGNNNPYCLDNEISWTNWNTTAMAKEILDFTKKLIQFRKQHKILHLSSEPRLMDYKSYGLPDMSYHGSKAWYADFSHFNRHFSVMYCGKYATIDGKEDEADLFIAYNMFWEMIKFGIPSARNKRQWKVVFATDSGFKEPSDGIERMLQVPPRSIVVLMAK